MSNVDTQWIPCQIENTGFSGERRFEVTFPEMSKAVGTASVQYFQTTKGEKIQDEFPAYGESASGRIQCRVLRRFEDGSLAVEFPSSDVFHVPFEALVDDD